MNKDVPKREIDKDFQANLSAAFAKGPPGKKKEEAAPRGRQETGSKGGHLGLAIDALSFADSKPK